MVNNSERYSTYQIVIIRLPGYPHSDGFHEIAKTLMYGLQSLGYTAIITENDFSETNINIILGAHLLSPEMLAKVPSSSIFYNLEQFDSQSMLNSTTVHLFENFTVWDYSKRNIDQFRQLGYIEDLYYVPVGYVPELTCIPKAPIQDIDVLFYGSPNPRRDMIIEQLKSHGLSVISLFGVYGEERDKFIARAKVIINIHYYDSSIFEIVRVSYLLSNYKAVVAECDENTEVADELRKAVSLTPYDKLVETCIELVNDDEKRHLLEKTGFECFSLIKESNILCDVINKMNYKVSSIPPFPRKINLGSGKTWLPDYLNIDINDYWNPDIAADISNGFPLNKEVNTERFGSIIIEEGLFEEIMAIHVLEHINDLSSAMTTCLKLLKPGGIFKIHVPYDLSCGAWQDPTHVRCFNERSWLYYTDWYWYLGWTEARFDLRENLFILNSRGLEMQANNASLADILASPRAVDEIHVVLIKRLLTDDEKKFVNNYLSH